VNEQLAFLCRRGHDLTDADNVWHSRGGKPECRQCLIDHVAAVRRWRGERGEELRRLGTSDAEIEELPV
jgi:hypothetical protein